MADASDDLGPKLTQLAEAVLDEVLAPGSETPLDHKMDVLKIVGQLYLGLAKLRGTLPDEDGDPENSVPAMRERIRMAGK